MTTDQITSWLTSAQPILIALAIKVIGAVLAFIAGRWLIGLAGRLLGSALTRQEVDATVQRYLVSFLTGALNIVLVVAILGYFGVETTTFAALVAGAGVAIGAAWSGLLSNFAAGIFLVVLRPFKTGDYVTIGGVEGTVTDIGLFGTGINTPDNIKTIVGNAKVMAGDIRNYSHNPFRRVDLVAQLAGTADANNAMSLLREAVGKIPNVARTAGGEPMVDAEILELNEFGPKLAVRPYCHTDHYWQVYFATNKTIVETLGAAGFPVATRPVKVYPV